SALWSSNQVLQPPRLSQWSKFVLVRTPRRVVLHRTERTRGRSPDDWNQHDWARQWCGGQSDQDPHRPSTTARHSSSCSRGLSFLASFTLLTSAESEQQRPNGSESRRSFGGSSFSPWLIFQESILKDSDSVSVVSRENGINHRQSRTMAGQVRPWNRKERRRSEAASLKNPGIWPIISPSIHSRSPCGIICNRVIRRSLPPSRPPCSKS